MLGACSILLQGPVTKGDLLGVVQEQLLNSVALVVVDVIARRLQGFYGVQVFAFVDERVLALSQVSWRLLVSSQL